MEPTQRNSLLKNQTSPSHKNSLSEINLEFSKNKENFIRI